MAEAARDLSRQEQEAPRSEGEKKPELRLVTDEEAPRLIDQMVEEFEEGAESGVQEMRQDGKALEDFASKQAANLNAEEARENADITARAEAAADKLRSDLASEVMPDAVASAEANMRALEAQYKGAPADQKRDLERKMEAASKELDEARAAARKKTEAPKEATESLVPEMDEPKVAPDFGQLLEHLSPEAQAAAAKNYAEADEEAYGGLASKQMTQDGVVRLGYKDGTIVEKFPGGQQRSNLPEAEGAERIPELPAYLQEAQPMEKEVPPGPGELSDADRAGIELAGVFVLEEDLQRDQEELAAIPAGANQERAAYLQKRIEATQGALAKKNTPEGLTKEIASLQQSIDEDISDMNLAPEAERGAYASRIDHWKAQQGQLEDRLAVANANEKAGMYAEAVAADAAAAPERSRGKSVMDRKDRMVKLENDMRELEAARKSADSPEAKKAIDKQLEDATKEWETLRSDWSAEDEAELQKAQAESAKKARVLALEGRMRELENDFKEAGDADKKAAIARDLEAATREWDALRKEDTGKAAPDAVAEAAALVAAAELVANAEAVPDKDKTPAEKKAVAEAKAAMESKSPTKAAKKEKEDQGSDHTKGGGGGGGKSEEKSDWKKKAEEAWGWAQKFFGGWTGVK